MTKPATENFLMKQAEVLRLKATDDGTGKPLTFEDVGKHLGLKRNGAWYYISKVRQGRCPCCFRQLDKPN
jgi:hypothetical protein